MTSNEIITTKFSPFHLNLLVFRFFEDFVFFALQVP